MVSNAGKNVGFAGAEQNYAFVFNTTAFSELKLNKQVKTYTTCKPVLGSC